MKERVYPDNITMIKNRLPMMYIIVQLMTSIAFGSTSCGPNILTTPAVYFEAAGGVSDKPIFPTILAVRNPADQEVQCALKAPLRSSATVFLVPSEELEGVAKIVLDDLAVVGKVKPRQERFRYVLVTPRGVRTGTLDRIGSKKIFADLETYFEHRSPKVHDHFGTLLKRLGN